MFKFHLVWNKIHDQRGMEPHPEEAFSVQYYYAYAAYYIPKQRHLGENMVTKLFYLTARFFRMVREPRWALVTLAFAFSARITALIHRRGRNADLCLHVMNVAIEKLEAGDRECATSVAMLSSVLAKWLTQWGFPEESRMEHLRTARIWGSMARA